MKTSEKNKMHTLIPFEDFKTILGVDDREDKTARFCLVTATLSIEQYCMRKLLRKKCFEYLDFYGDLFLPLREYPIVEILAVSAKGEILEPEFYRVNPDCGTDIDLPFSILLSPAVKRWRDLKYIKVTYLAGYAIGNVPADLASACLELATWNFNRYRSRRIGMTGSVRKDGDSFEMSMPENVRSLLEPYRRKLI